MEVVGGIVSNPIHIGRIGLRTQLCFNNNNNVKLMKSNYECCYYEEGKIGKGKKGWGEVSSKKKMKLLKGLSKDLITFTQMGFVDDDLHNSLIISKAAEVLLAQLKQLRSEEEKQKKIEKAEKKKCKNDKCESSSSESESSDSECDEVVDMKSMRNKPAEIKETRLLQLSTPSSSLALEEAKNKQMSLDNNSDKSCCNMILETTLNKDATIEVLSSNTSNLGQSNMGKKIEVCMGGKCKKSGAPALIEEFQKAIGDEGVVVGCKCMGKCKSGPNVKVSNGVDDDSMRIPNNPLYIGVGLEDVKLIAASYLGEEMKDLGLGQTIAGLVS